MRRLCPTSRTVRRSGCGSVPLVEIEERERVLQDAVSGLPPDIRRALLHVILSQEDQRAKAIHQLWARRPGDSIAELLMDLEEDRSMALDVAEALKETLRAR